MRRVREQLRFGTRLVWVLDPDARNVMIYQRGQEDDVVEETEESTNRKRIAWIAIFVVATVAASLAEDSQL